MTDLIHLDSKKVVVNDWNDELYVNDLYEQFLQTVQQEAKNKFSNITYDQSFTFEGYLKDCMSTLKWRRQELTQELARNDIDLRTYNNAKSVIEMSEGAIVKYLEKNDTMRLITI